VNTLFVSIACSFRPYSLILLFSHPNHIQKNLYLLLTLKRSDFRSCIRFSSVSRSSRRKSRFSSSILWQKSQRRHRILVIDRIGKLDIAILALTFFRVHVLPPLDFVTHRFFSFDRPSLPHRSLLPSTSRARGMVLMAPTSSSKIPAARRCSLLRLSASRKPIPAPSATRVPPIIASYGIVNVVSFIASSFGFLTSS
jgi:hypothetical protein